MTSFTNPQVFPETMPRHSGVALQSIEPAYRKVMMLNRIIFWLIVAVLFAVAWQFLVPAEAKFWFGIAALVFVLSGLGLGLFTASKAFENMGYALRQHDVIFRKGWLFEKLHLVPLKRIQHCVVKRSPLDRQFGLASLKIFTAGGAGADITICGLALGDAQALKDFLLQNPPDSFPQTEQEENAALG